MAVTGVLPPLPERMRPHTMEDYVGQRHLVGAGCILRNMIESGSLTSFILWGPPGVGKTTLAGIIAESLSRDFYTLSAVSAGVKDVKDIIAKAVATLCFPKARLRFSLSMKSTGSTRASRMPFWELSRTGR